LRLRDFAISDAITSRFGQDSAVVHGFDWVSQ
jgi:hypothetical protein